MTILLHTSMLLRLEKALPMGRYTSHMKDRIGHKNPDLVQDYFEGLWPFVGLGLYCHVNHDNGDNIA